MIKRVRGTQDILPQASGSWQEIEEVARRIFSLYEYQEIRTPIIENVSLFNRSLGETTEIVQKQMFQVKHEKDHLVLRPEGTAPIVRAYLENNLDKLKTVNKLYYLGPMFRAERPQKGRLRQFHHLGVEAIGSIMPQLDVEVISLADRILREAGITEFQIYLNTLGCPKDKAKLSYQLQKKLSSQVSHLCSECQNRLNRNVFRVLDCKNAACQKVVSGLDLNHDYLCSDCNEHFRAVIDGLKSINIDYKISHTLVRGLDYYTQTIFEIKHQELGAQDALGAGGRYDNLVAEFGGASSGAIGFAFGIERLLLVRNNQQSDTKDFKRSVYLVTLGTEANKKGVQLLHNLRINNICADTDYATRSLKAQMRKANDSGAKYCIIIGENELERGLFSLKDMESGQQKDISEANLLNEISNLVPNHRS